MPRPPAVALILSLQPPWWQAMLAGRKSLELRKYFDEAYTGLPMYIYVTRPIQAIEGSVRVLHVHRLPLERLWKLATNTAGVARVDFDAYFAGRTEGVGIQVGQIVRHRPLPLGRIHQRIPDWMPPMSHERVHSGDPILRLLPPRPEA